MNRAKATVLWFTGLSGAGKTTLARTVERELKSQGIACVVLDGDDLRSGLNSDLGFSEADRTENVRRVAEVARLFLKTGQMTLVALISPLQAQRDAARALFKKSEFVEVFVDAPLAVCEARDPKGLYRAARAKQVENFTGIDAAYEPPLCPELHLRTDRADPVELTQKILRYLERERAHIRS